MDGDEDDHISAMGILSSFSFCSIHKRVVRVVCFYWVDIAVVDLAYKKKMSVKKRGENRTFFFQCFGELAKRDMCVWTQGYLLLTSILCRAICILNFPMGLYQNVYKRLANGFIFGIACDFVPLKGTLAARGLFATSSGKRRST